LKGNPSAKNVLFKYKNEDLYVTDITIFEISRAIFKKKSKKELHDFLNFISRINIVPSLSNYALEAASIGANLSNIGITIDDNDLLIAGLLKSNNFSYLITRNKKHFENIKGLKIITY
jgi:predicted nucleic acid-binding protein